jgi:hypothetical protein
MHSESGAPIAAGAWLVLATVAAIAPAKYHGHYFLELIPPIGFSLMIAVRMLLWACRRRTRACVAITALIALMVVGAFQFRQYHQSALLTRRLQRHDFVAVAVSDLRRRNAIPGEYLAWGAEPVVYFALKSPTPTRFIYYYAFLHPDYARTHQLADALLSDVAQVEPAFIVDLSDFIGRPEFAIESPGSLDDAAADRRFTLQPFLDWISQRYERVDDPPAVGRDARLIPVYRRIDVDVSRTDVQP